MRSRHEPLARRRSLLLAFLAVVKPPCFPARPVGTIPLPAIERSHKVRSQADMELPPFALDHWLAAHEFATSPISYNLSSSTGPAWTLGDLLALGGDGSRLQALGETRVTYAPPE